MDPALSNLGCTVTVYTVSSGVHAAGLSTRGRAHARTSGTSGASHHGSSEAGLSRVTTSHQRSAGTSGYRRYISAVTIAAERGQVSRFGSARELMGYCGAVPSEDSSGKRIRRGGITKTGNAHLRRIVGEAAWSYRQRLVNGCPCAL